MGEVKKSEKKEDNPFEDKEIAEQWIRSIEGEKGKIRDKEIYPMLEEWSGELDGTILEIGSGQGICSQYLGKFNGTYIGIEPSEVLTQRAIDLYGDNKDLHFLLGNAYQLPIENESIEGVFSLNVWFHLADLDTASKELSRVLKINGKFNITTANPKSYDVWKTFYEDYKEEGNMISGKVNIPINPLSKNDLYMHTMKEMTKALERNNLKVEFAQTLGAMPEYPDKPLFVSIQGFKMPERPK